MKVKVIALKKILVPGIAEVEVNDETLKRMYSDNSGYIKTYIGRRARRAFDRGELDITWNTEESAEGEFKFIYEGNIEELLSLCEVEEDKEI